MPERGGERGVVRWGVLGGKGKKSHPRRRKDACNGWGEDTGFFWHVLDDYVSIFGLRE